MKNDNLPERYNEASLRKTLLSLTENKDVMGKLHLQMLTFSESSTVFKLKNKAKSNIKELQVSKNWN